MTQEQRDNQAMIEAARVAAKLLPQDSSGRIAIFKLIHAFESLIRDHNLCALRPFVTLLAEAKATCACTGPRLDGLNICATHAVDRHDYLGRKMGRLHLEATDLKPEHDELAHALQIHRATITKLPPGPSVGAKTPKKPLDPRLAALMAKLEALK